MLEGTSIAATMMEDVNSLEVLQAQRLTHFPTIFHRPIHCNKLVVKHEWCLESLASENQAKVRSLLLATFQW